MKIVQCCDGGILPRLAVDLGVILSASRLGILCVTQIFNLHVAILFGVCGVFLSGDSLLPL